MEGKRRKYFQPINFLLNVAALYVFMINLANPAGEAAAISKAEKARFEQRVKTSKFAKRYSNFVAMVATPLISFTLWLFTTNENTLTPNTWLLTCTFPALRC